jgi:hypothetical protein
MQVIAPLISYLIGALLVGYVGKNKMLGFWGLFLLALFLSPVVGLAAIFVEDQIRARRAAGEIVTIQPEPVPHKAK